ncbi:MAG: hypothetical protein Q9221_002213 [Calogaya cf. arnoldii]
MNAHVPHLRGKSNGSLLSPPSSPEMDQHLFAQVDGCWPNVLGEQYLPIRGPRPVFSQAYDETSMWIRQANISGNSPPAQPCSNRLDVSGSLWENQDSPQLAWSSPFVNEETEESDSAAQTDPYSHTTNQTHTLALGGPRPSPPASHGNGDEDDDLSTGSGEDDGQDPSDVPLKTAAERRAEKRKMKRFRLTHNQTRFLLSEFAHQAHPDAAQRERLSREIPGLSPRQVQVWFQNRYTLAAFIQSEMNTNSNNSRAKLKRLPVDDQESMLKSRALPAGFNNAQALNYAYDVPSYGNRAGPSSFFHRSHPEYEMRRPIVTGGLNLVGDTNDSISPSSVVSSFVDTSFPASETISPISPLSEMSHFFTPPTSQGTSPRASGSFTRSSSFPTIHQTPWRRHGSPLQQRLVRSRAGSSAFPASQTARPVEQNGYHPGISSHACQPHPYSQQPLMAPGGVAHGSDPNYNLSHTTYPVEEGFETNGTAWTDPNLDTSGYSPSYAVNMTEHRTYGSVGTPSQAQHSRPVRQVQSAPLAAPPEFYLPEWTTPYPPGGAYFPSVLDYSQGSSTDQLWMPSQGPLTHQPQHPHQSQYQTHATMGSSYNEGNATPRPEHIEGWPA